VYGFYGHKQPQANADEVRLFRRLRGGSGAPQQEAPKPGNNQLQLKRGKKDYPPREAFVLLNER
jgi:hypothetical protein